MSDEQTTDLYRFHDADGALLYVGISVSAIQRMANHKHDKGWWSEVAAMSVEKVRGGRREALEAERTAIRAEHPKYNVVHNGPHPLVVDDDFARRVAAQSRADQGLPRYVDESVKAAASAILTMALPRPREPRRIVKVADIPTEPWWLS